MARHSFQLSGFSDEVKGHLSIKIEMLGGVYHETEHFQPSCTHIVCKRPSRSEKFLGGCATGKWLLSPDYIRESARMGRWLPEENYEWNNTLFHLVDKPETKYMLGAPRYWRTKIKKAGHYAFTGWNVAVVVAHQKKRTVYKRLLEAGGATLVDLPTPLRNIRQVMNRVTHVFVDDASKDLVAALHRRGVPCLDPLYIGDYLLQDSPPSVKLFNVFERNLTMKQELVLGGTPRWSQESSSAASHREPTDVVKKESGGSLSAPVLKNHCVQMKQKSVRKCTQQVKSSQATRESFSEADVNKYSQKGSQESTDQEDEVVYQGTQYTPCKTNSTTQDTPSKISPPQNTNGCAKTPDGPKLYVNFFKKTTQATLKSSTPKVSGFTSTPVPSPKSDSKHSSPLCSLIRTPVKSPGSPSKAKRRTRQDKRIATQSNTILSYFTSSPVFGNQRKQMTKTIASFFVKKESSPCDEKPPAGISLTPVKSGAHSQEVVETPKTEVKRKNLLKDSLLMKEGSPSVSNMGQQNMPIYTSEKSKTVSPVLQKCVPTVPNQNVNQNMSASSLKRPASESVAEPEKALKRRKLSNVREDDTVSRNISNGDRQHKCNPVSMDIDSVPMDTHTGVDSHVENSDTSKRNLQTKDDVKAGGAEESTSVEMKGQKTGQKPSLMTDATKQKRRSLRISKKANQESVKNGSDLPCESPEQTQPLKVKKVNFNDNKSVERSRDVAGNQTEQTCDGSSVGRGRKVSQGKVSTDNAPNNVRRPLQKSSITDDAVSAAVQQLEKQKVGSDSMILPAGSLAWRPNDMLKNGAATVRQPMTGLQCSLFGVHMDECQYIGALDYLRSTINSRTHPDSQVINDVITRILKPGYNSFTSHRAYMLLQEILLIHPSYEPAMVPVYLQALIDSDEPDSHLSKQWCLLRDTIRKACDLEAVADERLAHRLLMKYLVTLLEQNFYHNRPGVTCIKKQWQRSVLSAILWPGGLAYGFNTACRELIMLMVQAWQITDSELRVEIISSLHSLVAMAATCCASVDGGNDPSVTLGEQARHFTLEVAYRIKSELCNNSATMEHLLKYIRPSWLSLHVAKATLDMMDDSLLPLVDTSSDAVTMAMIVNRYMYLLPPLTNKGITSPHKKNRTSKRVLTDKNISVESKTKKEAMTLRTRAQETNGSDKADTVVPGSKQTRDINRRNAKGETALHVACIKNNIVKVRELLSKPGINVNIKDYAGWTPLHEACNHGNIECVTELLRFRPVETITNFFSTPGKSLTCGRVDISAGNDENITPLHDAVLNNQMEVVKVLLKFGGARLLKDKTTKGYTAADLASTDEMVEVLSNAATDNGKSVLVRRMSFSSSQGSVSEEQKENVSDACRPTDHTYQQVVGINKIASEESVRKYCLFLSHVFLTYIKIQCICKIGHLINNYANQNGSGSRDGLARSAKVNLAGRSNGSCGVTQKNCGKVALAPINQGFSTRSGRTVKPQHSVVNLKSQQTMKSQEMALIPHRRVACKKATDLPAQLLPVRGSWDTSTLTSDLQTLCDLEKYVKYFESHLERISSTSTTNIKQITFLRLCPQMFLEIG